MTVLIRSVPLYKRHKWKHFQHFEIIQQQQHHHAVDRKHETAELQTWSKNSRIHPNNHVLQTENTKTITVTVGMFLSKEFATQSSG